MNTIIIDERIEGEDIINEINLICKDTRLNKIKIDIYYGNILTRTVYANRQHSDNFTINIEPILLFLAYYHKIKFVTEIDVDDIEFLYERVDDDIKEQLKNYVLYNSKNGELFGFGFAGKDSKVKLLNDDFVFKHFKLVK